MAVDKSRRRGCKCNYTGERGMTDSFYKAPDGKYYKDEATYGQHLADKEAQKFLNEYIARKYLDYTEGNRNFNTYLPKRIKEYVGKVKLTTLKRTFLECENTIDEACRTKRFHNDFVKLRYIFAIIDSNLAKVERKEIAESKRAANHKIVADTKAKKLAIAEETILLDDMVELRRERRERVKRINKHKDISRFVEEE